VARLPGRPGVLAVKRVFGRSAAGWWLEGDNPSASTDSRRVGAVADHDVTARVLLRYWPRPGLLRRPRPGAQGDPHGRAAADSSSAR